MATKTLSCVLTAPELQKRKATIIAELKSLIVSRNELSNGYSFELDASDGTLDRVTDFIKTERMCCDFFTFQLTVEKDKVFLTVAGPDGAKQFLADEVGL